MQDNGQTGVSVVMAVYNSADFIQRTVDSVLAQQAVELDFIIVNDGSAKPTTDLLNSIAGDPRVTLIQQRNQGLTAALINGCAQAKHNFIARIDAGDEMLPMRLVAQANTLLDNPKSGLVCSSVDTVTAAGEYLFSSHFSAQELALGLRSGTQEALQVPVHASVMFRREVYSQVGGYRRQFYLAQDLDLWSRILEVSDISVLEQTLTKATFLPQGISARFAPQQRELNQLVQRLIVARKNGEDEAPLLVEAEEISKAATPEIKPDRFAGNYFIAKCLLGRDRLLARKYLLRALRHRLYSVKTWLALARTFQFGRF